MAAGRDPLPKSPNGPVATGFFSDLLDLILQRQTALERVAHPLERRSGELMFTASRDEMFLLDDIVFSVVSLYDYCGSWCDFLYNVELKARRGFGLLRASSAPVGSKEAAAEPASNQLRDTLVVQQAKRENENWLKGLAEYRGALIHGRADEPKGSVRHTFAARGQDRETKAFTEATVSAPDSLLKKVRLLARDTVGPVTVSQAAEGLNDEATRGLRRLLRSIVHDLGVAADPNVSKLSFGSEL